ncbi:MAG: UDP-N-acetylmuramoyl-L-alanyl-D-glutamate--2,6-diaminopimelate ligase [Polyangiaceae bacterium]
MTEVRLELHGAFATVAVTGTNGKTTTTGMVEAIVAASGEPHARVTTLGGWVDGQPVGEGPTLDAFARAIELGHAAGMRTLALETTSRALAEGFAHLWRPTVAVFTNLSRDHLDYHGDPEHYLAAKAQLFMLLPAEGAAVLNACDPASALLDEVTPPGVRRLAYAGALPRVAEDCRKLPIELAVERIELSAEGTRAKLAPGPLGDALGGELVLGVFGEHNVENALAAALSTHALGYAPAAIARGLAAFRGVKGRFERVHERPSVVVDYAHTPDALERTLRLARRLAGSGRVLCVFGCGGGSDPGKRAEMGRIAAELADVVVVTSDNPRSEDPAEIAAAIQSGVGEEGSSSLRRPKERELVWLTELDRKTAIERAIEIAWTSPDDIVVVAGKGHETTQCVQDETFPFDDGEVARAACEMLRKRGLNEDRS